LMVIVDGPTMTGTAALRETWSRGTNHTATNGPLIPR